MGANNDQIAIHLITTLDIHHLCTHAPTTECPEDDAKPEMESSMLLLVPLSTSGYG